MSSLKAEKAVGTQLFGQAKKEPAKADASAKTPASKAASKKQPAQKPQEPKKKVCMPACHINMSPYV